MCVKPRNGLIDSDFSRWYYEKENARDADRHPCLVYAHNGQEAKMKKAILAVSFGTSYLDTLERTIGAIEREVQEAFPDRKVYRAFTSGMVLRKLREEMGIHIMDVEEAVLAMERDGVEEVFVQPTHIINGYEYEKMKTMLQPYRARFVRMEMGMPLLSSVEDYSEAVRAVMKEAGLEKNETLVLMGHGTEHHTNAAYPALDYMFWAEGFRNVVVGTVEGFPKIRDVIRKLKEQKAEKLLLMPFMIVAGDHARNDMAGEEEGSWKSMLEKAGFQVRICMKGLGEMDGIRRMFVRHLSEAEEKKR